RGAAGPRRPRGWCPRSAGTARCSSSWWRSSAGLLSDLVGVCGQGGVALAADDECTGVPVLPAAHEDRQRGVGLALDESRLACSGDVSGQFGVVGGDRLGVLVQRLADLRDGLLALALQGLTLGEEISHGVSEDEGV